MLTLEQAKNLRYGDILCEVTVKGSDGNHRRWKVSGAIQLWKRDANRIRVPLKHGLYAYDAITESDFRDGESRFLCLASNCDCGN
jgi:hypothetical protein